MSDAGGFDLKGWHMSEEEALLRGTALPVLAVEQQTPWFPHSSITDRQNVC